MILNRKIQYMIAISLSTILCATAYIHGIAIEYLATGFCLSLLLAHWFISRSNPTLTKKRRQKHATRRNNLRPLETAIGYKYGTNGLTRDVQRAFNCFLDIINKPEIPENELYEAVYELADCYENGIGVPSNINHAIHWYKVCHINGYLNQEDRRERYNALIVRLIATMQTSAHNGDANSMYALGYYYRHQHLETDQAPNPERAFNWFHQAAELKHRAAIAELANCYYHGVGTKTDYLASELLLRELIDQNGTTSHRMSLVGCLIHQGKRDEAQAIFNAEREKNNPDTEFMKFEEELRQFYFLDRDVEGRKPLEEIINFASELTPNYNIFHQGDAGEPSSESPTLDRNAFEQLIDRAYQQLHDNRATTPIDSNMETPGGQTEPKPNLFQTPHYPETQSAVLDVPTDFAETLNLSIFETPKQDAEHRLEQPQSLGTISKRLSPELGHE